MKGEFFNAYPEFPSYHKHNNIRLNTRYQAIIEDNLEYLKNMRVLDLASNDGRWSFAALKVGAEHCTGIEARSDFFDNAHQIFGRYGVPPTNINLSMAMFFFVFRRLNRGRLIQCLYQAFFTIRLNMKNLFSCFVKLEQKP